MGNKALKPSRIINNKYNCKKLKISEIFEKSKFMIIFSTIFQYFDLIELLQISKINLKVFNYIKLRKNTKYLCKLKKNFLKSFKHSVTLENILLILKKIRSEPEFNPIAYEYLAYHMIKYIFNQEVSFHHINNETNIIYIFKHLKDSSQKYKFQKFSLFRCYFEQENFIKLLNYSFKGKYFENLKILNLSENQLNDECLKPLNKFLGQNKYKFVEIYLSYNYIGRGEESLKFLENLKMCDSIEKVYLSYCEFEFSSVPIIIDLINKKSNLKILDLRKNKFKLEDIQIIFKRHEVKLEENFKTVLLSFEFSPIYIISKKRSIHFNYNLKLSEEENNRSNEYYDKHLRDLYFENLKIFYFKNIPQFEYVIKYILNMSGELIEELNISPDLISENVMDFFKIFLTGKNKIRNLGIFLFSSTSEEKKKFRSFLEFLKENDLECIESILVNSKHLDSQTLIRILDFVRVKNLKELRICGTRNIKDKILIRIGI